MTNPSRDRTNAADSAPGVGDGPVRGGVDPVDARPGSRGKLKWVLLAVAIILVAGLLTRGWTPGGGERTSIGTPAASDTTGDAGPTAKGEDTPLVP